MKTGLEKNLPKTSAAVANNGYTTKGISMPAVPALQKKSSEEEEPLQMVAAPIQMEEPRTAAIEEEAPQTPVTTTTTSPSTATSPAGMGAMAYAQGSNVNMAPSPTGELPHEEEHPVQQKVANPAAQLTAQPVVQRVVVGEPGVSGAIFLAVTHFPAVIYTEAKAVLDGLQAAGTVFATVADIITAVNAHATVIAARAAAVQIADLGGGTILRQSHVTNGALTAIVPARDDGACELVTNIGGVTYRFHVHPPAHPGQRYIAGEIMRAGAATGRQTSYDTITAIIATHPRPAGW